METMSPSKLSPLLQFWWFLCPWKSHREERWERAPGKQHLCPAENGKCRSESLSIWSSVGGHQFLSLFLLSIAFTTSLNRLIHSPDAEAVWSNYADHYVLKWAIYIGKCRLKILWFQHSSKYKPLIYCVYGVPSYDKEFWYLIFLFCLDFPRATTKLICSLWEHTCW